MCESAASGQVNRVCVRTGLQVLHRSEALQEIGSNSQRLSEHRQVPCSIFSNTRISCCSCSIYCGSSDPVYSDALMHLGYCNLSIDLTSAAVTCFEVSKPLLPLSLSLCPSFVHQTGNQTIAWLPLRNANCCRSVYKYSGVCQPATAFRPQACLRCYCHLPICNQIY